MAQNDTVNTKCNAYLGMVDDWDLIDSLLGGTRKMREMRETYLPMDPKELNAAYSSRLSRTFLKPALRTAIETGIGEVFQREINIEKVNPALKPLLDDVDLQGNDITRFLSFAFQDMLTYGHCHLLATYPSMGDGATLADARDIGARPYGVRLDPRNVFSWRKITQSGPETLAEVRFFETVERPQTEWDADSYVTRIYVLRRGEWHTFESPASSVTSTSLRQRTIGGGEWTTVGGGLLVLPGSNSDEIPWTTIYGNKVGFMVSRPPFIDLAWLNLRHWQQYSDYANILHVAQVPTLFTAGIGAGDEPIVIGSSNALCADDPHAQAKWLEITGGSITAGRQELLDIEAVMDKLGSALFADDSRKPGGITATQVAVDTAEETAPLAGIKRSLEDGANQFLWHLGRWLGLSDAGKLAIGRVQPVLSEGGPVRSQNSMTEGSQSNNA